MKKTLIALGLILILPFVAAAVAPKEFKIEKSFTIDRPSSEVFAYIKMMQNNKNWQPWSSLDPNIKRELNGEDGLVGAILTWSGNPQVGAGEQEIKSISEGQRIEYELRFKEPMNTTNTSFITTEAVNDYQTVVTWNMEGRTDFPMNLISYLMHDKVAQDFTNGLKNLKEILEKPSEAQAKVEAIEEPAKTEEQIN
jgi:uncharacterized protein YndB with AHSA1/START domain